MVKPNTKRTAIGVVGSARMGVALSHTLASAGHDVVLFTTLEDRARALREEGTLPEIVPELEKFHPGVKVTTSAQVLAEQTTFVFVTLSDYYLERVLDVLGDWLDASHIVVHATHSLYGDELKRASELIETLTCVKQIGALAGPIHVSGMLAKNPNVAMVGSEFPEIISRTRTILSGSHFHVHGTTDIRGVEFAAALHQVVALGAGLADGVELGSATHSALVAAGLNEMSRIGVAFGAAKESFYGLVGVGRLVDALQRGEPNYELGRALARAINREEVITKFQVEAKSPEIIERVLAWAAANGMSLPFVEAIGRVTRGQSKAEDECRSLMTMSQLFIQMNV